MKLLKTLMAGLLAMAFVASAQASTIKIYLVGSTAYRASVHTAIINALNTGSGGVYTYAYDSSSGASGLGATPGSAAAGSGASQQIYSGTIAGQAVIIKTNWTGSAGGIQAVTQHIATNFLADGALSGATSSGLLVSSSTFLNDSETPTVTMSDVFQASTPFTSPSLSAARGNSTNFVGVVPFVFVINADWPGSSAGAVSATNVFNVTPQIARNLWANGSTSLALFTGSNADENTSVYALGRDNDSGTRLTAFAETGIGVFSTVVQYQPQFGGSVTSLTVSGSGANYTSPTVTIYGSGGFGYTSAPTVTASGGGGSASLTATLTGSTVTAITVNSSSGYTSAPSITITGGTVSPAVGAAASAVVDTNAGSATVGQLTQVVIANPGSGATATASLTSGSISGFSITNAGSGFQAAPTVLITDSTGAGASATVKAGNYVVTNVTQWPAETVNGIGLLAGQGGYSSGGSLAIALGTTGGANITLGAGYMLSYLGTSDASTATGLDSNADGNYTGTGLGAKVCSYNGVAFSPSALDEGKYTFWGYEHMYYGTGLTSITGGTTVVNTIATQIASSDAVVKVSNTTGSGKFNVTRSTDGGVVAPNY